MVPCSVRDLRPKPETSHYLGLPGNSGKQWGDCETVQLVFGKGVTLSPFRRRRRIGLRPARPKALEADAMAEAVGIPSVGARAEVWRAFSRVFPESPDEPILFP